MHFGTIKAKSNAKTPEKSNLQRYLWCISKSREGVKVWGTPRLPPHLSARTQGEITKAPEMVLGSSVSPHEEAMKHRDDFSHLQGPSTPADNRDKKSQEGALLLVTNS